MVVRKRRKKNTLRGNRVHGKGDTKNKRGAGCRGGRGRAGSHKHKFTKYWKTFGKFGKLKVKKTLIGINLSDLVEKLPKLVLTKKVEQEKGAYIIDGKKLKFDKILGRGKLNEQLIVKNLEVTKKAAEIIKKAGGKIEKLKEEITDKDVEEQDEELADDDFEETSDMDEK
ncbi:MAG: uL15 family ribosomal protein [Candidatus Diapherotrites archaeon]